MNKTRIGVLLTALITFAFFSCDNQLLSTPHVPGDDSGGRSAVLDGLTASHGEKQSITLSWNQNSNAALYYVYKADSPLDTFSRCAETSNAQYKFSVSPGTTVYYRVSFVSRDGRESSQSMYVRGTSLAQPFISDITDKNESSVTVTWYMDNVSDDTYKGSLLYTVYCFNGSTEVAQIALDGSTLAENKATFNNLSANAEYEFQVEAYLRSDQSASEKSDKVNAATARRMRPAAPDDLLASHGTAKDKIELTFKLPEMVDIAIGENQYDQKPVYFKISKRRYSTSGNNEYLPVCLYFGSIEANTNVLGGKSFNGYTPGATVTWTDSAVSRGVEYEYQVQSYVDDTTKVISSDSSKASARGWALSEGTLSFGDIDYTLNELGTEYKSAQLPLEFDFDPKGVTYDYSLVEKIEPIADGNSNNPSNNINREINTFTRYNEIKNYVAKMNLTQQTTAQMPGRGLYSYAVAIKLNDKTIDTVSTIGEVEISENTDPIIVEGFSVQDGYTDRFVFKWHYHGNRKYVLSASNDRTIWTEIDTVNPNPDDASTIRIDNYSHTYMQGITPGLTKYFRIQPSRDVSTDGSGDFRQGQMVYATTASRTLGVPELSLGTDASYSTITAMWTEAQKADAYRIKYWYTGEGSYDSAVIAATISKNDPALIDAGDKFKYQFMPFINNALDAAKAGKEIQVAVDALNIDLQTKVGGGEIATTSNENVKTQLVGPALLNPSASHAVSPNQIEVSWNKIDGANGYYVFRRQFNMNNTAEEGAEAVVYYVPALETPAINITGKNLALVSGTKEDTTTVKAAALFSGSRYTLEDIYLPDDSKDYDSHTEAYRNQQNNMAQGYSYRYYIVPVINRNSSPEPLTSIEFFYLKDGSNKNTDISNYTILENGNRIRYNGAAAFEKDGFTIGFGQNVTATKGTYASSGNVNNGIQISWSAPPRLASVAGFISRYNVYRRVSGGSTWETVFTDIGATQYVDTPTMRGVAYEYVVGITNGNSGTGSQPHASRRFIERCGTYRDERNRPNYLGFMIDIVRMNSVSRDERKGSNGNFGEMVNWYAGGVKTSYSADNNWGIDGYTIYVMNRNINANWHEFADVTNFSDQLNQSFLVTTGMKSFSFTSTGVNNNFDLLRVMRDYRHYFKVRSYVLNSLGEKVYCPDPAYTWSNGGENDYVKWGARQITTNEFITVALIFAANGIQEIDGNSWSIVSDGTHNANGTGTSGKVSRSHTGGTLFNWAVDWTFTFENYREDIQARTGDWLTFLALNGKIWARSDASSQYPQRWGDLGLFDVTGPADTPGLYTGRMKIGNPDDLNWTSGKIYVHYPNDTALQTISYKGEDTPLPFKDKSNERHNLEQFK